MSAPVIDALPPRQQRVLAGLDPVDAGAVVTLARAVARVCGHRLGCADLRCARRAWTDPRT